MNSNLNRYYFTTLLLLLGTMSHLKAQKLRLHNFYGDQMVLQRGEELTFKGVAKANAEVQVLFANRSILTKSDKEGYWLATTEALPAGGPYELIVKQEKETLKLKDILIGDLWLCGGQSNMEWLLKNTHKADADIPKAHYPQVRHLKIKKDLSYHLKKDILPTQWEKATPANAGEFTAVGYYFAKYLHAELGVPIGLINSSWGGSHVETWISQDAMKKSKVLRYYPPNMPKTREEEGRFMEKKIIKRIYGNEDFNIRQIKEADYFNKNYDFSQWIKVGPGQWDWQNFSGYRGEAFIHKDVWLSEVFPKKMTEFSFGSNAGLFTLFVNGKIVAKGVYPEGIKFKIPPKTWVKGKNQILIITSQNGKKGVMGHFGGKESFYIKTENEKVNLADEKWDMIPRWNDKRYYAKWMNNAGSICYNAMIAPLTNIPIKGAIWYQGESNAARAHQYRQSFPLLIDNWRKDWNHEFPFFFVQLSSFGTSQSSNEGSNWAELREAQSMALSLPKTGMAVTIDIGNPNDIHPKNKLDVGERLAKSALKVAFGKDIVGNCPMYSGMSVKKGKVTISFSDVGSGLVVKDKYGYLKGFEIAGADQKFYYAKAEIEGNKAVVSHPMVDKPMAVRYAWTNAPEDANLFNKEGFPVSPFRTDSWQRVTEGVMFE